MLVKFGLDVDAASFAEGEVAASAVKKALEVLAEVAERVVSDLIDVAKGAIETATELRLTSQAVGLTTDALQELTFVGARAGVDMFEMAQSIGLLSRNMLHAKEGGQEQAKMFSKLGVKVTDAHGKLRSADEMIASIADKFEKMQDGPEKTALALELFGRAGKRMVPLLNEGSEGIERMRQEARDLGIVLDEETIKKGKEVDDTLRSLEAAWKGIRNAAVAPLLPEILRIARAVREWVKANREWLRQGIESKLRALIAVGKFVYETFALIARNADLIAYSLAALAVAFVAVRFSSIAAAAATVEAWMAAAAPFLLIASTIAGFLLMFDDIRMYAKYGDKANTITGQFVKSLKKLEEEQAGDSWILKQVKAIVHNLRVAIEYIHEMHDALSGTEAKPASGSSVTSASPAFKKAAAMAPKTQQQAIREQQQAVGGRLDAERNAGFFEGIFWRLNKPSFDFTSPGSGPNMSTPEGVARAVPELRSAQMGRSPGSVTIAPQLNLSIDASGMSPEELRPMIREEFQTMSDTIHEDALAAMSR